MGCSIAYNLAVKGMTDVLLLERDVLGSGSTGRSTASVHTHFSTETLARMAWNSLLMFQRFNDVVGGECGFTETGHLVFAGKSDYARTIASVSLQKNIGIETDIIDRKDAAEIAPGFDLDDCSAIAYEPLSGYADASGTTLAYAARARQLGVRTDLQSPATSLEIKAGRVSAVVTSQGRISTDSAIVAAGPWSKDLLAPYGIDLPLRVTRHEVAAFSRRAVDLNNLPGASDIANQIYLRPEGKDLMLVGSGGPGEIVQNACEYGHRPTQGFIESVWTRLVKRIPIMKHAEYTNEFAGLYTSTPDRHPIVDQLGGIEGLYLCTGFSGHGIMLAPAAGTAMAELVLDGEASSIDISSLRMTRFQPGHHSGVEQKHIVEYGEYREYREYGADIVV